MNAQDKIIFKNGEELNIKFVEKTETQIKYRRSNNLDGPLIVVSQTRFSRLNMKTAQPICFHHYHLNLHI